MSNQVQAKVSTALQLIEEADAEKSKGALLARQIDELTRESARLVESEKQKRATAMSELKSLAAPKAAPVAVAAAASTTPKRGSKAAAAPAASAPTAAAPAAAPVASKSPAKKGPKAKEAKGAKGKGQKKATKAAKTSEAAVAAAPAPAVAPAADDPTKPSLHERLKIVIGNDSVNIAQAIDKLRAHNPSWVPESTDLKAYISLALSTHVKDVGNSPALFERVTRGVYRVRTAAKVAAAPARVTGARGPKKAVTTAKTNGTQNPSNGAGGIEDLGSNVLESPFAGAAA